MVNRTNLPPPRVLITDDEKDVRWLLSVLMRDEGFEPLEAADGPAALRIIRQGRADVMLLDLLMPGMSGLELFREVRRLDAALPVILATGSGTAQSAEQAGKYGAAGFLTKPFKNDELVFAVRMALQRRRRGDNPAPSPLDCGLPLREVLGPSPQIQRVVAQIELVAPTDFTVVLSGETGVGKEVVATALHRRSPRSAGPFVPVDCGSIPETLIESELFGHEKGAFTGADRARKGCFETAAGGTLFLDEIGNLPLAMQARLLRALQERRIYRVGSSAPVPLDVRILAASNENLPALVEEGKFRRDLYYRLNEFSIRIPPLRERVEDILFLAERFRQWTCADLDKQVQRLSDAAVEFLRAWPWPGNVRELRNLVRRAVLLADTQIDLEHLATAGPPPSAPLELEGPVTEHEADGPVSFKEAVRRLTRDAERDVLRRVLKQTHGNMKKAAAVLQIDYKTMRTKARQYNLISVE